MYVALLFCVGLILVSIMYTSFQKQENIIKLIMISILLYFSFYIFFSGISFWLNVFRIEYIEAVIICVSLVIILLRRKTLSTVSIDFTMKQYLLPIIILFCTMPFTLSKYEFFGMGQDEGVYQTQAIEFIYNYNDIQKDFEEYDLLDSQEAKQEFAESLQEDLIGLYNYDTTLPFASEKKELSEVSAVFHGIPTFSAILALFGKMFGIRQMAVVQTLFYICSVFFIFFILEELNVKKAIQMVSTSLFAFSPMILWVSKSSLTEIGLVCLVLGMIYFVICVDRKKILWSTIPIIAFSYYHFTIYTIFPAFVLMYLGLYMRDKEKRYLIALAVINTGFFSGMMMSWMIAGTYTFTYNMWGLYTVLPGSNQNNIACYLGILCMMIYLICGVLYKKNYQMDRFVELCIKWKDFITRFVYVGCVLYQGVILLEYREKYFGGVNTFRHLTLAGFGFCVGILLPAVAGILVIFRGTQNFRGKQGTIILWLFTYCILIYACVMRKDIAYYHYYGRYLAPYIAIVLIFSAMALQCFSSRIIYIMGIVSLLILLPYEHVLLFEKDDTRVTWDVIEELIAELEEESVVLVSREDMKYFYLPIRVMTKVTVFPKTESILKEIDEKYNTFYLVETDNQEFDDMNAIWSKEYQMSEDNNEYDGKWIPFPLDVTKTIKTVILYKNYINQ